MLTYKLYILIFLLCFGAAVEGASILALFSSLSFSDHLVFRGYVSQLVQRGHSVVVMTPYPGHFEYPDVERIIELDVSQESAPFWDEYLKLVTNVDDYYPRLRSLNEFSLKLAIAQLRSKQMTALFINPNIKFDLVITEADVPLLYAVADKYKVPHIAITPTTGKIHQYESKGTPVHPLWYPDVNTLNLKNLNIWQKVTELNRYIQTRREYYNNLIPFSQIAAEKILGLKRDLLEVEYDIDMLLVAANPLLIGNRPSVPAIVYADRMHIKPLGPMPQGLQHLLDSSTKGVIYFSFGAIQEVESLSKHFLENLVAAFRELPYKVLWKIENTTSINVPENVIVQPWFPQQEILAHPHVKAFVTNGGLRSLEEAVFYEVPIVALPVQKSRKVFIDQITKYGAGLIVDPYKLDKDAIKSAIINVASNDKFKKGMSAVKYRTQDAMISGPESAVWWTEYVLRNRGARHFRSAAVGVSFAEYYMLDIVAFVLAGAAISIWILSTILKFIFGCCCCRRPRAMPEKSGKFKEL